MKYFFILGRNPGLSLAELHATLPTGYKPIACFREVLVVECGGLDVDQLMRRLGGVVKIGEIINLPRHPERLPSQAGSEGSRAFIDGILQSLRSFRMTETNKKFFLGLSAYALGNKARLPSVRQLRELGMEIKRGLHAQGQKVRLVTSKEITLSSVIVKKEKLLTQGAEIVLFYNQSNNQLTNPQINQSLFIGRTLAVQEFAEASARDFGRPERSMGVGMLPIQLAKIMINLARAPLNATILDPFCGFGTILGEAMLMGYPNLMGSDLEQKMVDATRKNLEWLCAKPGVRCQVSGVRLLRSPAEQLSKHLPPHSVDAIVTEPYMGPTREIRNSKLEIRNLIDLYIAAFREFTKILKPGGCVVFIFPAFKTNGTLTKTSDNVLPKIKNLGFEPINLLPDTYHLTPNTSIIYSRPDQRVLREIFVLVKK